MGLFDKLTTEGLEETQDRLGGSRILESDIYLAQIKMAYAGKSAGGAHNITLVLGLENGNEYRETHYITNKQGENFFRNRQDESKKIPLPGFTIIDDLCLVTTEKPLAQQDAEEKVVKIYDFEQAKEMPTSVQMLTDLIGKMAYFAITKDIENKNEKSGDQYVPTADTREVNTTQKIFHHPSKMTVVEARSGAKEPEFFEAWVEKHKGKNRDRRSIKDGPQGGKQGRPGGPPKAGENSTPKTSSLFNS